LHEVPASVEIVHFVNVPVFFESVGAFGFLVDASDNTIVYKLRAAVGGDIKVLVLLKHCVHDQAAFVVFQVVLVGQYVLFRDTQERADQGVLCSFSSI